MKKFHKTALLLAFSFLVNGCGSFVERNEKDLLGNPTFESESFKGYRNGAFLTVWHFKDRVLKEKKTGYIKDFAVFESHVRRHRHLCEWGKLLKSANSSKIILLEKELDWDFKQIVDYSAFKVIRSAFSPNEKYDPSKKMFFRPWGYPYDYVHPKYGDEVWVMIGNTLR